MTKTLSFEINGTQKTAYVQRIGDTLWVHLDAETFTYEPEKRSAHRKKVSGSLSVTDVVAPMPGKVTKVSVSEGDQVSVGQLLIMLEAMKMEYSLKALVSGKVKGVECKTGDQVTLGQLLVAIEPAAKQ